MITKNSWDERFLRGEHTGQPPLPVVLRAAGRLSPGRALDVACGAGRHTTALLERGWQVTAIDGSPVALALVDPRAERIHTDLEAPGFRLPDGEWDLVVNALYLHRPLLPQLQAATRPGGLIVAVYLASGRFGITLDEAAGLFPGWTILEQDQNPSTVALVARKPSGGPGLSALDFPPRTESLHPRPSGRHR